MVDGDDVDIGADESSTEDIAACEKLSVSHDIT
jgi:hypothetical protein